MDSQGLIPMSVIVKSAINRTGMDKRFYEKLLQIGLECFSDLNIFVTSTFRTEKLTVNSVNIAPLPSDYIDYCDIYVIRHGKKWSLTRNEALAFPRTEDCGEDSNQHPNIEHQHHHLGYDYDGMLWGHQYGTSGGGNFCYYRIDKERRQIVFQGKILDGVFYLDYVSTGIKMDGRTLVPRECETTIRAYIIWQSSINNPLVPMNQKELNKKEYQDALKWLSAFTHSFSMVEYKDLLYSTSRQAPKR